MIDSIIPALKSLGAELVTALIAAVGAFAAVQLRRLADVITVQGAIDRSVGAALDAMSPDTEGEPADEGAAVSAAHDYLSAAVPSAAKRLGADLGSIARAAVVAEIGKAISK